MNCHICERESFPFAKANMLEKYAIQYFQCSHCGFVQTEDPFWLEEAYENVINESDVGYVYRNLNYSRMARTIIFLFYNQHEKFLDYGGGYGLFTRMMRDAGMNFFHHDDYCENNFARAFEANLDDKKSYELITAFEVVEHFAEPLKEIKQVLEYSENILFSTSLLPSDGPKPDDWWYFGLEHGQHISIYTEESLQILAEKLHLNFYSDGKAVHLFTRKKLPPFIFRFLVRYKFAIPLGMFLRKRSLLPDDFHKITGLHQ